MKQPLFSTAITAKMTTLSTSLRASLIGAALVLSAHASAVDAPFSELTYQWTKGSYAGSQYQLLLNNNSLHWQGLKGAEKGLSGTETQVEYVDLGNNRQLITWLETSGYTVTLIINSNNQKIDGVVSKDKEHHVISGDINSVKKNKLNLPSQRAQTGRRPNS